MHLHFQTKVPGAGMQVAPVNMEFHYSNRFGERVLPEAYERLLLDSIQGDASLFARSDEIELAWHLIDPFTDQRDNHYPKTPSSYAPGSPGPEEADDLLACTGHRWRSGCSHSA
jgi:glucose-6-phosphate 1-dehydrogenase